MDEDLERALAASRAEQEQLEEDEQLLAAIELSKRESGVTASNSFEDQLRERTARMKRKADDDLRTDTRKRPTPGPSPKTAQTRVPGSRSPTPSLSPSPPPPPSAFAIKYPDGALRITRTPGRKESKNCVNLQDVIHKEHLVSACIYSFFIGDDELFDHLPLSHTSDTVPIYVGRDANMDPLLQAACSQAGVSFKDKLSNKQLQSVTPNLRQLYSKHCGKNYHAFYAWSPGSSHSKILVLVYPEFLRIVITSCNMMNIDTILGDNHWYIHDLPKLSKRAKGDPSQFEAGFLVHLQALSTPDAFVDSIRGMYDYSRVKVHLVTSAPGVCSGIKAERHGLLRLRSIVQSLKLNLSEKYSKDLTLEICAASIGKLNAKWLSGFRDCALGKEKIKIANDNCSVPALKLFYPSVGDVKSADASAQDAASNIGCHTRPWDDAPKDIKDIFHHYESKDAGRLFHQKLIMAYNPNDMKLPPYFVYVGSANFSQSAWGGLEQDKKENKATCNIKLVKLSNLECGVVVPGNLILGLLEDGTKSWQDGIIPYVQTAKKYDLPKDRPWNDPRWVQDYQEDWRGSGS